MSSSADAAGSGQDETSHRSAVANVDQNGKPLSGLSGGFAGENEYFGDKNGAGTGGNADQQSDADAAEPEPRPPPGGDDVIIQPEAAASPAAKDTKYVDGPTNELIGRDEECKVGSKSDENATNKARADGPESTSIVHDDTIHTCKSDTEGMHDVHNEPQEDGVDGDVANIDSPLHSDSTTAKASHSSPPHPASPKAGAETETDTIALIETSTANTETSTANTTLNYPTALQKTLQLMAETDINTTEYTPTNSMDMRYRGPSASHPQRMPGLSSLPAMFSESQPALFDLGQGGGSGLRSSPKKDGNDADAGSGSGSAGGIIYEETDEERDGQGGGDDLSTASSSADPEAAGNAALEGRIDELEKMVAKLTDLLLNQQEQQQQQQSGANNAIAMSPVAAQAAATAATFAKENGGGDETITATPARAASGENNEEVTPLFVTKTPAAPDLVHSNVLPLDSPSPSPRRKNVEMLSGKDTGEYNSADVPSPPRLGGEGTAPTTNPAVDGNATSHDVTPAQPTPDLEYRSYSQEHVDALRRRREVVARRSYSFDVAEQLEREISQEAVNATLMPTTVRKSSRKPNLSPVPPSPSLAMDKDTRGEGATKGEEENEKTVCAEAAKSAPTPTLAPRPHSGRSDGKAPPQKMDMPNLVLDDGESKDGKKPRRKSTDRSNDDGEDRPRPPSHSNSSASLSSKVRSASVTSSKDDTEPAGASPSKNKKAPSSKKSKSSATPSSVKETPLKHKASCDVLEKNKESSSSPSKSSKSSEVPQKQTMMSYIKKEMMIDSSRQEGSAADDVDANMEEFLRVPAKLEKLFFFAFWICTDAFLYALTILPIKFVWSCICLVASIIRPRKGFGSLSFHFWHLYQILQMSVVIVVYRYVLMPVSIGVLYHWIRGQATLKLYVLIGIVEVFDRLLCSIGQDALDSLYWNCNRRPYHPRMIISTSVVLLYATAHSLLLFLHVATLNVAMNSSDHALLTLLISGNFAEIKSTVFKKYNLPNLFKISASDICERFKLALFLVLILILNCFQGGMNQAKILQYFRTCGIVLVAEVLSDWIKHSFITKFNFIKSSVYPDYALILAGDLTGIGHEGINLNHTHAVVKRLGFSQIPIVCVMLRFLSEAMRYAIVFSHGDASSEYFFNTFAFWYVEGRWAMLAGAMFGVFFLTLVLKVVLGFALLGVARRMLEGPADDVQKDTGATAPLRL